MRIQTRLSICVIFLISVVLILAGCETKKMTLNYADGSGNLYIVVSHPKPHLSYQPVQAATSSSGLYSGGEPVERDLSHEDLKALSDKVQAALNNPTVHIKERVKMSGALELRSDDRTVSIILQPACTEQIELENLLKQLRS